jgi:hypothetical protein
MSKPIYRYAFKALSSGELLSYNGRVLVHNNKAEMEFLFAKTMHRLEVIEISEQFARERELLRLADHPALTSVEFPLRESDFRDEKR